VFDFESAISASNAGSESQRDGRRFYFAVKRMFDVVFSVTLLPVMMFVASLLFLLNPLFNPGPLFYTQPRMGRDCRAFTTLKFRTMLPVQRVVRGAEDPVEADRIRHLGRFLRKVRIDELPQILNVLRGDMSLIGPRPDYFHHARRFVRQVPGYRERHSIRPGISGLAQVEVGYAQGVDATRRKVKADLDYIERAGFLMDAWVFWRTLRVVFGAKGL